MSEMLSDAERLPLAVGVKVTLIVQHRPVPSELPQVLAWAKSPALVPVIARLLMFRSRLPITFRLTVRAALLVPTGWFPKERLVRERVTSASAVCVKEKPTLQGAEKMASAAMAARRAVRVAHA